MLYLLVAVFVFNRFAFWFLGIASILYYPICIYYYFLYGRMNGNWMSMNNDGLVSIAAGLGFLLMIVITYLFEKFLKRKSPNKYIARVGYSDDLILTKYITHLIVFVYILSAFSLLKIDF